MEKPKIPDKLVPLFMRWRDKKDKMNPEEYKKGIGRIAIMDMEFAESCVDYLLYGKD